MAIHVSVELNLQPGKADEFVSMAKSSFKDTRDKKGFIEIVAAQATDDPNKIIFWETWETLEDYNAYFNWRVETGFMDAIGPFLTKPPVKTLLNPV